MSLASDGNPKLVTGRCIYNKGEVSLRNLNSHGLGKDLQVSAQRTGVGSYLIEIEGSKSKDLKNGVAVVTGTRLRRPVSAFWNGDKQLRVECFNDNGVRDDTNFTFIIASSV